MSEKVVTLLPSEQIKRRLAEVDDNPYMAKRFHPLLAAEGGRELVAMGIVMMLNLKIHDFSSQDYPPVIGALLQMNIPRYIDCLTDDQTVAEEAKLIWQEVLEKSKKGGEA